MVARFSLILTILSSVGLVESIQCYKCVSPYLTVVWEKVNLTRTKAGEEIMGTSLCLNDSTKIQTIKCSSECGLLKIFGVINHEELLFGVMRDCANSRSFWKLKYSLDLSQNDSFDVCRHDYCNGLAKKRGSFPSSACLPFSRFGLILILLCLIFI